MRHDPKRTERGLDYFDYHVTRHDYLMKFGTGNELLAQLEDDWPVFRDCGAHMPAVLRDRWLELLIEMQIMAIERLRKMGREFVVGHSRPPTPEEQNADTEHDCGAVAKTMDYMLNKVLPVTSSATLGDE